MIDWKDALRDMAVAIPIAIMFSVLVDGVGARHLSFISFAGCLAIGWFARDIRRFLVGIVWRIELWLGSQR